MELGVTLAMQLKEYIKDRAREEGKNFSLELDVFEEAVEKQVKTFGVVHDGHQILYDEQEPFPGYLDGWLLSYWESLN